MEETTRAHFTASTAQSVVEALTAVEAALAAHQFSVLWHLDINQKFREKGLQPGPEFHVLEVCSAPRAQKALDLNQQVGYFLPCKIVVFEEARSRTTHIGLLRPRLMVELLAEPQLEPLADEVEELLKAAILDAVR